MTWQLAEAKNKMSEVFDRALRDGPQEISRRGKDRAYLISADEYERLRGTPKSFLQLLLDGPPLEGLDLERDQSLDRDVEL